jgi:hypothetical protein
MNKEFALRTIMAIIYKDGPWANQSEKIDDILMFISDQFLEISKENNNE